MRKNNKTSAKRSFFERHPSLNSVLTTFLSITLFVAAAWIFDWIVRYISNQVIVFLNLLLTTVSKLDVVVIVALITGMVSIVGVVISSVVSKFIEYRKNRQDYLAQKREIPYGEFVDMVYKLQGAIKNKNSYTQEEMTADISKFSKQLTLWGSHRVVNKWVQFRENGTDPESAKKNLLLMEDIMNEMRHDLGLKRVKQGKLLAFFINDMKKTMKEMKK